MGWRMVCRLVAASGLLCFIGLYGLSTALETWAQGHGVVALTIGSLSSIFMMVSMMCLDCSRLSPADSHSLASLLFQYIYRLALITIGRYSYFLWQKNLNNCRLDQDAILTHMLKSNAQTEYGKIYNFPGINTREDYVRAHPVTTDADYEPYMNRIANKGEQHLLSHHKVKYLCLTSGTTGKNKMFPACEGVLGELLFQFLGVLYCAFRGGSMKRVLQYRLYPKERFSPSGIPMGGASVAWTKPFPHNLIPKCFTKVTQEKPAQYIQAIFALSDSELGGIEGFSSNILLAFFKFIQKYHQSMCDDIERGDISTDMDIPEDIRLDLKRLFRANPMRAQFLRKEFRKGIQEIAARIWPELEYVNVATTGSFTLCANILKKSFLKGVYVITCGHVATEGGIMGAVLNAPLDSTTYTMLAFSSFMEFIPLEDVEKESPKMLFMDQVEAGQCYEVVATNRNGLYRIRFGDVIKVVGFVGNTPLYEFQYRLGQILTIAFERTPESLVQEAVAKCEQLWPGATVVDFTSCESFVLEQVTGKSVEDSSYVLFLEVCENDNNYSLSDAQKNQLDDMLCELHEPYKSYRLKGSIAPMRIIQVYPGTFDDLKHRLWGDFQNMQFKMPRVQRREQFIRFLLESEIA